MLKLFSADDHIIEHQRVWTDRLPARLRELGPHVISEGGRDRWVFENGQGFFLSSLWAATPSLREKLQANEPRVGNPENYGEMLPGCYDPRAQCRPIC